MSDRWQEAVSTAEEAVRGEAGALPRATAAVTHLRAEPVPLRRPSLGRDLAYLTALLESVGLGAEAHALLEHVVWSVQWDPDAISLPGSVRNELAVVLADRGHLPAALALLSTAAVLHIDAGPDAVAAGTWANLAAVRMRSGDLPGAERSARRAQKMLPADVSSHAEVEAQLLAESVLAESARQQGRDAAADEFVHAIGRTARRLVRLLGSDHPSALAALITLSRAEFASARAAGDRERMESVNDVLAIAAQKASAALGRHHPLSESSLVNLATSEFEAAQSSGDPRRLSAAKAMILMAAEHPLQKQRLHPVHSPSMSGDRITQTDYATARHGPSSPVESARSRTEQRRGHDPHDRSGAKLMFVELRKLPDGSAEYAELRNQLVRMHLPLVEHLARRFRNRGEPLDDLTQVATIGLIKSVDRFDPERGVEFSTYATPTVVGEIKRHFRDKGWAVRVPRRLQELRLALTAATAELSQQHGRSPTVHELAEKLGISEDEVLEGLESANAYSTLSLDVPDTDDESPAVADTLGAEDAALEYRESLKPLLADLPPREKRILLLRFFGNMTQSQIAQEVGISQMHVSRLLARTLAQLREKLLVEE